MEPISIFGLLSTAGTLASAITLTIKQLSDLRTQYKNAGVRIRLLIGELSTVKAALAQINDWTHYLDDTHRQADVVEGLNVALEGCQLALDALAGEVRSLLDGADLQSSPSPGFRSRTRYAWSESSLKEHEGRLHAQIAALQLLLQAVHCQSSPAQVELLHRPESRQIFQKVADDTSTLRATLNQRNSHSAPPTIVSHDDSTIDEKVFEWDNEIVNADIYRRAMNHAKEKSQMAEKSIGRIEKLDAISQTEKEESLDQLSAMESSSDVENQKLSPYETSMESESLHKEQEVVIISNSSMSDKPSSRKSILSYRLKSADRDKRSFWPSVIRKGGHRNVAQQEYVMAPGLNISRSSTPGTRRGRRGFENSHHTSIDFGSEDGLSTPPLIRASQAGSVKQVEVLLDQHADINARHVPSGRNALMVASHCGNAEVVRLLLQYGAAANELDSSSLSALHLATIRGHVDVVDLLLQDHANVDIKGPDDRTPLRIASEKGQVEVAEKLIRKHARVNARDKGQMTPLHVAARHEDASIASLLVSHGAHVEARDANFMGPLHHASKAGCCDVVSILLSHKADIEARGKASMTPLMCASSSGKVNVVELLCKKKASLKQKGEGDMNALHWASFNGHAEVVDFLLQKRAQVAAANKDGRTPLHLAVMAGEFAVADLLLRAGAPVEGQCKSGLRPLHYACTRASLEITLLLLGYNANAEGEDVSGHRPLHSACTRGSLAHVDLLIKKGVNVDARSMKGDRCLCIASAMGHVQVVQALLNHGAAMRTKFAPGPSHEDSPLCLAAKGGHSAVVRELLARGASVLQRDERNWQPLRYAAFYGHLELVELLLTHGATVTGIGFGGWGFDITAQRIGFANDVAIDASRKNQIVRLLANAEAREQKTEDPKTPSARSYSTYSNPHTISPLELPNTAMVKSRIPTPEIASPPSQPSTVPELTAETRRSLNHTLPKSDKPGESVERSATTLQQQTTPQLMRQAESLEFPSNVRNSTSRNQLKSSPQDPSIPTTFDGNFSATSYPTQVSSPTTAKATDRPRSPVLPAVLKPVSSNSPSRSFNPANQSQPLVATDSQVMGNPAAPSPTLGPDGLWRQLPPRTPGAGQIWATYDTLQSQPATPITYPAGMYEMAS